jgi:glycosyltransferase involved in cell wall biosynthesis
MKNKKRVLFDDVFFNIANTGIARLWHSVLTFLSENMHIIPEEYEFVILNRSNKLASLNFEKIDFPNYDHWLPNMDRTLLTNLAKNEHIDLFVSSYYTFPIGVPTLLPVYDLIPEKIGFNRESRGWLERELGFTYANSYFAISESTKSDLIDRYKFVDSAKVHVHYPGVDGRIFQTASKSDIDSFKANHSLNNFAMMVGSRKGYKNGDVVFKAIKHGGLKGYDLVLVGGDNPSDYEKKIASDANLNLHYLNLDDSELATCFSAASVLLYPSLYEGFGLPPLEALACGTPVIVMNSSSLPEAVGKLGIYMTSSTVAEFNRCLEASKSDSWIKKISIEGPEWATNFTWEKMAYGFIQAVSDELKNGTSSLNPQIDQYLEKYTNLLNMYQR